MNLGDDHYIRVCSLEDAPPHVKLLHPVNEEQRAVRRVGQAPAPWFVVTWKNEWPVASQGQLVAKLLSGRAGARFTVESNGWQFIFVSVGEE